MAVYTEVSDADLAQFVARYDLGAPLSLKGIAEGVENSNFLLVTEAGPHILTLYEKRVDPADLPFFLGLMEHLNAAGVPCPLPVHDRAGAALGMLCGRPAAIITFLSGLWPRRIEPAHCQALGQVMAQMHLAAADYPAKRANALGVDAWAPLFAKCRNEAEAVFPGISARIDAELTAIAKAWPSQLPSTVIHADLFPDNVFFKGETLSGVIDFYFACTGAAAYDLAICLNAWCFEPDGAFNATKARRLFDGYAAIRPLTDAERSALPILARGAALRFLLTRLHDWVFHDPNALVRPKDPMEYVKKLASHGEISGPGAYGL